MRLVDESKKLIEQYVGQDLISDSIFQSLWKATTKKDILKILKIELSVNEITLPKIWIFIIQTEWSNMEKIFDRREIILLKELLKHDGVLLRTSIQDVILNQYNITKAINTLYDRNVIDILTLTSNEKIIILKPTFKNKIWQKE